MYAKDQLTVAYTIHVHTYWAVLRKKGPNVLSRCHTKRRTGAHDLARPTFGMTPTEDIRDLFAQRSPIYSTRLPFYLKAT